MGGLALLIVYTVLVGLAEIKFDVTVGEIVARLLRFLTGG